MTHLRGEGVWPYGAGDGGVYTPVPPPYPVRRRAGGWGDFACMPQDRWQARTMKQILTIKRNSFCLQKMANDEKMSLPSIPITGRVCPAFAKGKRNTETGRATASIGPTREN